MECPEARVRLLEADLSPDGVPEDPVLAEHVRTCSRCAGLTREIVRTERLMDGAMDRLSSLRPLDRIPGKVRRSRGPLRRHLPWLAPLAAAAAAVLALTLVGPMGRGGKDPSPVVEPAVVEAPPGRTALVLDPGRSDLQVIWLF